MASYNSVRSGPRPSRKGGNRRQDDQALLLRQSLDAPEGVISLDPETQHTWRPFYLAKARLDGQFDIIWSVDKPIRPSPYPITRSPADWDAFLQEMYTRWGDLGQPQSPGRSSTSG